MANLSVYVSTAVNGVAKIHSQILRDSLFHDWYKVFPERFQNKTNGITPRRWARPVHPGAVRPHEEKVGPGFLKGSRPAGRS